LCLPGSIVQCLPEPARNEAGGTIIPRKARAASGTTGAPPRATKATSASSTGDSQTVSGYFRKAFAENPSLLDSRSNDELLQRWLKDHPGETDVPRNVKVGLQNVKSVLRGKSRRRRKAKTAATLATSQVSQPTGTGVKRNKLEALEERIDDTLTFARGLDDEGLHDVVGLLRRARNEVVWKMGQ
jgi:hypothetical protein